MKDKEKHIEEILCFMDTNISAKKIAELIPSKIVSYDGRSKGQHLYIEQKMEIAKEMMKQGAVVLSREELEEKYEPSEKFMAVVRELEDLKQNLEDKVVLSKAKYEMLVACSSYEGVIGKLKDEYVRGSKETAEKFYEFAKAWFGDDEQNDYFVEVKNLAKSLGVEIKE